MLRTGLLLVAGCVALASRGVADDVPRPEHPRPLAVRAHWSNLNGVWQFRFDPDDEGLRAKWFEDGAGAGFDRQIVVPFPWESELSGIHDTTGASKVGWYRRTFVVPSTFPAGERVILHFGAVDWRASVWVNGTRVVDNVVSGYAPFSADVTETVHRDGAENVVVVRAFDATDPETPTGKQVGWYTTTSGIWQTVWLESRPTASIGDDFTIVTAIDPATATITVPVTGVEGQAEGYTVGVKSQDGTVAAVEAPVREGKATLIVPVADAKLWTPETPQLYEVGLELRKGGEVVDSVGTYFGLRTIARGKLPGENFERFLLNGKPVFLRLALDQSFNPKGIYTAPSDDYLKRDLLLSRFAGLNGLRIHIKGEEPRRLYWADRIGLLIMQDMPCTSRQTESARAAWEEVARRLVVRDRNHPSIFAWVAFNETWGLNSGRGQTYRTDADTQGWVQRMVQAIRELDPTRLVEDNSPCNHDHVAGTDVNSWHFYTDDHEAARAHVAEVVEKSHEGSPFNHCPGFTMNSAPLMNSEYGAVGSGDGDRDISWGFRDLTTLLRKYDSIQGYVYTELSDIEWEHNGYYNYDRSPKIFGYEEWVPDMWVNELQQPDFVGYDAPPVIVAKPGETVTVPVFISHYSDRNHPVKMRYWVQGHDDRGDMLTVVSPRTIDASWEPYKVTTQEPITFTAPERPFVGALALTLRDPTVPEGQHQPRFAANFVNLVVRPEGATRRVERRNNTTAVLRFAPEDFAASTWSTPATREVEGGRAEGLGTGALEYRIRVPESVVKAKPATLTLRLEAGARAKSERLDWPSRTNRQDNPQTDGRPWAGDGLEGLGDMRSLLNRVREVGHAWPTTLTITLNGREVAREGLENDAADSRGVLSHLNGEDHGRFGEAVLLDVELTDDDRRLLEDGKPLVIGLTVPEGSSPAGGLTVFGAGTGMYPFDPTMEITTESLLPDDLGVDPSAPVAVDRIVTRTETILPTGEGRTRDPVEWMWTTDQPGDGWEQPGYDDSAWATAPAPFGTSGTPGIRPRTEWNTPQVWLRKRVNLAEGATDARLVLRLYHDEDVTVYVNGRELVQADGFVNRFEDLVLDPSQRALFQEGMNTIAVTCRQTAGGQGVGVGLLRIETGPR
jgi:hypothetical protein